MYLIVPVDNRMGMAFHHRRQSQDRVLREYLLSLTKSSLLRMNAYSAALFGPAGQIRISEDFLEISRDGDFCFTENRDPAPFEEKIQGIILCRWNRDYPGDLMFRMDFSRFKLCSREEFPGFSHEKLTIEVYEK